MRALVMTAAALALAAAFAAPATAQQASQHAAADDGASPCAFGQVTLQASADSDAQRLEETRAKVDALIDQALASTRSAKVAQSPVVFPPKSGPDG